MGTSEPHNLNGTIFDVLLGRLHVFQNRLIELDGAAAVKPAHPPEAVLDPGEDAENP